MFSPMYFGIFNNYFKGFKYTIQQNDTLEMISKRYRVPVNLIITANKLSYPYILKEDSKIFIPGIDEPVASDGGSIYTVKYGDNLTKISKKFNISVQEIMDKNFLNNQASIYIGQKLLIPSKIDDEKKKPDNNSSNIQKEIDDKNQIKIYSSPKDIPINTSNKQSTSGISSKFSIIKIGDKGKDIVTLKRLVGALGYKIRKFDSYFDSNLEQHIKKIQKNAGFEPSGYVDQKIWSHIFELVNSMPGMYN